MNKENEMKEIREMKLSDCKNMMRILAEASIKQAGEYRCTIDGVKVIVRRAI